MFKNHQTYDFEMLGSHWEEIVPIRNYNDTNEPIKNNTTLLLAVLRMLPYNFIHLHHHMLKFVPSANKIWHLSHDPTICIIHDFPRSGSRELLSKQYISNNTIFIKSIIRS